ncbi:hypothetical protein Ptr902_14218, partial [Pyrenophora tritici-repentis]
MSRIPRAGSPSTGPGNRPPGPAVQRSVRGRAGRRARPGDRREARRGFGNGWFFIARIKLIDLLSR